ncbi:MAG: serpin family protein [Bacteroidales bacterium]|nr:serpin family protein [Bacteroidales bacterium]
MRLNHIRSLFSIIATIAFYTVVIWACQPEDIVSQNNLAPRKDIVLTRAQSEFVSKNLDFSFELFKHVSQNKRDRTVVISPLSVTMALGMIDNGSFNETKTEIEKVLGYSSSTIGELNEFCKTMLAESSAIDPSTVVSFANSAIFNDDICSIKADFIKNLESSYDAFVSHNSFSKEDVRFLINSWCNNKTQGMIPELLNKRAEGYAYFINALYFKGIWANRFNKKNTTTKKFYTLAGETQPVKMMRQNGSFMAGTVPGLCKILRMDYGNGAYQMFILLPEQGHDLADVTDYLSPYTWNDIVENLRMYKVDLEVPSFESEYTADLKSALIGMGIHSAFKSSADFSRMTDDKGVFIEEVYQKTKFMMDEKGTEAASASVVKLNLITGPAASNEMPEMQFHADHPFLFSIREVSTGAIFFIGQYTGQ